ncbi:hypothetical protein BMF94_3091 [Rhodotorula taiwanensis]|uniref:Uncharacterized protein n=1 Tax=Rhodotorula taiwanensis TaxID=741276 RepID=A0A2S5BAW9_9BASI|nr:hypothetical protein BMF94_3091 [Rhodotorula taiwanensis]
MTSAIPRPASVPPLPSSPRQPSSTLATGSKIPRRRTSPSQSVDLSSANVADMDARTYPTSVPSSPDKRATSGGGGSGQHHARRPSRTQFLPPPPPTTMTNAPLIERRRSSASANAAIDGITASNRPRTPSLSIQIPVASSVPQSRSQSRPQERHVTHALDSTAHRQARRMGHSRTASGELSPLKATGPRASQRRCSAPVHSSTAGLVDSAPVHSSTAGLVDSAPGTPAPPFPRVPRTPYPFASAAGGATPVSARSHRPPMLERTLSDSTMATYTSFDLQHPRTPEEEDREVSRRGGGGECGGSRIWRWLSFWRRSPSRLDLDIEAADGSPSKQTKPRSQLAAVDETTALLGGGDSRPQTRWEYVWGEIVCYAKHMLPPIFVFVVVVLVIALLAYRQGIRRIAQPPPG